MGVQEGKSSKTGGQRGSPVLGGGLERDEANVGMSECLRNSEKARDSGAGHPQGRAGEGEIKKAGRGRMALQTTKKTLVFFKM